MKNKLYLKQLHAGYVLDAVWKLSEQCFDDSLDWKDVWHYNSVFEVTGTLDLDSNSRDPIFAVAENIVSRGFPTRAHYSLEKHYSDKYPFFSLHKDEINTLYSEIDVTKQQIECFQQAMFLVDPEIKPESLAPEDLVYLDSRGEQVPASFAERLFLSRKIVQEFGNDFGYLPQILDTQRSVETLVDYPGKRANMFSKISRIVLDNSLSENKDEFYAQRTDFALQFPAGDSYQGEDGVIIEVDGKHHDGPIQQLLDKKRDSLLEEVGWAKTIRYPATGKLPESSLNLLRAFLNHPYAEGLRQNYIRPLCTSLDGKIAADIVWGPLQVARLTRALLRTVQAGGLSLEQPSWNIFVQEQDGFDWSLLAVKEFVQLVSDLLLIEGRGRTVPDILLSIKQSDSVERTSYIIADADYVEVEDDPSAHYDLAIDTSLLKRRITIRQSNLSKECSNAKHYLWIRSAYAPITHSEIICDTHIHYKPLLQIDENNEPIIISKERVDALIRLLQMIFRKSEFREKQLDVLNLALKNNNVIALLPTGAGKSLIFQMASFLQPGISVVVEPLKSLMADQIQNLVDHRIDVSFAISSNLTAEEKQRAIGDFKNGQYQLFYLSPERLLIDDFRIALQEMKSDNGKWCHYCIVDEAHCVSEWGHDFRTSYLRLGDNARRLVPTSDDGAITMMALTGTASYDVLADIQRELGIKDRLAVITPKSFRRDELNFYVELLPPSNNNRKAMYSSRKESTITSLEKVPSLLGSGSSFVDFVRPAERKTNAGLLFCPHARGGFGVNSSQWYNGFYSFLTQRLTPIAPVIGKFTGQDDSEDNERNQCLFKENELSLLVATKAFGMGVDKPNIRYTLHTCMPSSIEAFYQEAGRAGRDRKKSVCIILHEPGSEDKPSPDLTVLDWFHNNAYPSKEIDYKKAEALFLAKSYFTNSIKSSIRNQIEEIFGVSISLKGTKEGLVVNSWDRTSQSNILYGKILFTTDLEIQASSCQRLNIEAKLLVLEQIRDRIIVGMEETGTQSGYEFFNDYRIEETQNSMASMLETMECGKKPRFFIINFEGNAVTLLVLSILTRWSRRVGSENLSRNACDRMREALLEHKDKSKDANEFVQKATDFLLKHQNRFVEGKDFTQKAIEDAFYQMLNPGDTFKIVYRLSILGVIKDYEVDYKSKVINAKIAKLTLHEYMDKFAEYLSRYESPEYIKKQNLHQITNAKTVTEAIKIALKKLIDFTYDKIVKKRRAQIDLMRRTVEKGSQGSEQFAEEIYGYFEAKYVEELRNQVCARNVLYDYSQVEYWLNQRIKEDETGAYHDNVSHLRGTCNRLISEGESENPILYLLRSFTFLVNPAYNRKDGLEDLRTGWTLYSRYKDLSIDDCASLMRRLNNRILADIQDQELASLLNDEVEVLYIDKLKNKLDGLHQELTRVNQELWG